ncbi:hypothetical protein [Faecalibaculum rodentium]|uniref:hypothetical protein n=1 Tax=Faecalibaculum rodentium TaxID=1702221 RepID=UPI0027311FF5|nr:hypothetical protein [Faecalibaculum rodentium]
MAQIDISSEISQISNAVYGKDVRSSIVAALTKLNNALVNFEPVVKAATEEYLDDHPEAVTSVQDGSISWAKLASAVQTRVTTTETTVSNILNGNTLMLKEEVE